MKLDELIEYLKYKDLINFKNVEISGISYNSKTTKKGDIFVCLVGEHTDGHEYAQMAVDNGATALLVEHEVENISVPQVQVDSTRHKIADIADRFYSSPSKGLNLIGITGTNGKTTVTHLIQKIFEENNEKCALIGTLGYKLSSDGGYRDAKHTTPQAPELQATVRMIKDFDTMDNDFKAKALLFQKLTEGDFAVINTDDEYGERFLSVVPEGVRKYTYGVKKDADIMAKNIKFSLNGAEFTLCINGESYNVNLHMNGMFSVYNVLAALGSSVATGIDIKVALKALENVHGVAGRFEVVNKKPLVIVDYAHTPDGLENVLKSAREITPDGGKLICLFGCGGDRDATKRPKMGAIAQKLADKIIITSDNPRSEDPQQIITDIIAGLASVSPDIVTVEPDRGEAISLLKSLANNNDVVIIAGKGHEDYQILKDKTIHFDDREQARKVFAGSVI